MLRKLLGACVGLAMMGMAGAATAVPITGEYIDAELYEVTGSFIHVLTQFTSPALIVDPGSEFSGVLQFGSVCPNNGCFSGIEMDFDDTGFTVFSTPIDSFESHNGSQFGITIFNLPDNIIGVLEFPGLGFEAELNIIPGFGIDLRYSCWSRGSVDRYGFVFSTPTAVPEPSALSLFATGLAVLGFLGWRRRKAAATA